PTATVTLTGVATKTVVTDSLGNYTFGGIPAGNYVVNLTVPFGYGATTTNPASVVNPSSPPSPVVNFGIAPNKMAVIFIGGTASKSDCSGNGFLFDTNNDGTIKNYNLPTWVKNYLQADPIVNAGLTSLDFAYFSYASDASGLTGYCGGTGEK